MRHLTARKCALTLALCLLAGAEVRADPVPWYYTSSPMPGTIQSDTPGMGSITLSGVVSGQVTGDSSIVLANLATQSSADPSSPATFTNANYKLALNILDANSAQSGTMFFTGQINGDLSSGNALILNNFTGQSTQTQTIGNHQYTVSIGSFAPPGVPGVGFGSISALARVTVQDVPEPSTLALSGLAVSLFGVRLWRRRRSPRARACAAA
jgi:hypothetical protein